MGICQAVFEENWSSYERNSLKKVWPLFFSLCLMFLSQKLLLFNWVFYERGARFLPRPATDIYLAIVVNPTGGAIEAQKLFSLGVGGSTSLVLTNSNF